MILYHGTNMVPRGKKLPRGTCNFGKILHKISV